MDIWNVIDSFLYSKNITKKAILYYLKVTFSLLVIILVLFFIYFGRQKWISLREMEAQKSLAQLITQFREYQAGTIESAELLTLHQRIATEQEKHRNSYIAPYFATLQAEVFIQDGDLAQALNALDNALSFQPDHITKNIITTKRALLLLDIDAQKGIEQLQMLVADKDNMVIDIAQFYLGRYYWIQNNIEEATKIWQELVNQQSEHRVSQSPYAAEASMYLATLGTKI